MDTWRLRRTANYQTERMLPPELRQLTSENRVMLDEVMELTTGTSTSFNVMPQTERAHELDRLVRMAVSTKNHCAASKKLILV